MAESVGGKWIRLVDVVEKVSVKVCYNICCLPEQVLDLRKYHCGLM